MTLFTRYAAAKVALANAIGVPEDLLHVHLGLVIFVVGLFVFRRARRLGLSVALVYFFALLNELVDALSGTPGTSKWEPLADIVNTALWPTALALIMTHVGRRRGNRSLE